MAQKNLLKTRQVTIRNLLSSLNLNYRYDFIIGGIHYDKVPAMFLDRLVKNSYNEYVGGKIVITIRI